MLSKLGGIDKFHDGAVEFIGFEDDDLVFALAQQGGRDVEGLLGTGRGVESADVEAVDEDEAPGS